MADDVTKKREACMDALADTLNGLPECTTDKQIAKAMERLSAKLATIWEGE